MNWKWVLKAENKQGVLAIKKTSMPNFLGKMHLLMNPFQSYGFILQAIFNTWALNERNVWADDTCFIPPLTQVVSVPHWVSSVPCGGGFAGGFDGTLPFGILQIQFLTASQFKSFQLFENVASKTLTNWKRRANISVIEQTSRLSLTSDHSAKLKNVSGITLMPQTLRHIPCCIKW